MSRDVYIVGVGSTRFAKWPQADLAQLAEQAVSAALQDGQIDPASLQQGFFGNCAMHVWGQNNIRGQVTLGAMMRGGALPDDLPIVNVEAGCATGTTALAGGFGAVAAGVVDTALVVGAEKTFVPDDPKAMFGLFAGGADQLDSQRWLDGLAGEGERTGVGFAPHPMRIVFLDVHAMQARWHMQQFGTTAEQLAAVAVKNHQNGADNERAQLGLKLDIEAVLADKPIVEPLTRAMCSPISDGAAAAVLVSAQRLADLPKEVQERAVRIRAVTLTGGRESRRIDEPSVVTRGVAAGMDAAGVSARDIGVAEVHDATAYCEIAATEAIGFCKPGQGGELAASGATARDGEHPVNPSGGLESKGHPLGATGLGMADELVRQLRGEAGPIQVAGEPTVGLLQNAGGLTGLDEAVCGVVVMERA